MAKKTVINRACKKFLNSSNDSNLTLDHFNRQDEAVEEAKAQEEINENANSEVIDANWNDVPDEPETKETQQEKTNVDDVMNDMDQQETQESSRGF